MAATAAKRVGQGTLKFASPPVIVATASVAGPMEVQGPLGQAFDQGVQDPYYGEDSWEKAERKMLEEAVQIVLTKASLKAKDIDFFLAGDLLNQTISANFAARKLGIPFLGLYGACSTMYEGLALASILIDGGFAHHVVAACSSHYETAERQYRFPVEQGVQRPPSAQRTVTGAAAVLLAPVGNGPRVAEATLGRVLDVGVRDPYDMGAAMAPAAVDTILQHLQDTGRQPGDYSQIMTGDLGKVGHDLAIELAKKQGQELGKVYNDCGLIIFDRAKQDVHAGGSGCASSALVLTTYVMGKLNDGSFKRFLGVGTGALLSPVSSQQGESIPGIGHAVMIEK